MSGETTTPGLVLVVDRGKCEKSSATFVRTHLALPSHSPRVPTMNLPERIPCPDPVRASVVVLHGYGASGSVHRTDGRAFAGPHTEVVLPDAPGHGTRDDGRLARIRALPDDERLPAILDLARAWADELPDLAQACRARGAERIVLVGISMGGFAALRALAAPSPFAAVAALLAAPDLVDRDRLRPRQPPLLLGLAGRDEAVDPAPGRAFARDYGAELREYPVSGHFLREHDWHDLWSHTAAFVRRHAVA
jgi:pimeloyl-ACP methyl ester carboxylesterase